MWRSVHRKVWLILLTIFLSFSVALVLAEFSLKKIEKYQRKYQASEIDRLRRYRSTEWVRARRVSPGEFYRLRY